MHSHFLGLDSREKGPWAHPHPHEGPFHCSFCRYLNAAEIIYFAALQHKCKAGRLNGVYDLFYVFWSFTRQAVLLGCHGKVVVVGGRPPNTSAEGALADQA